MCSAAPPGPGAAALRPAGAPRAGATVRGLRPTALRSAGTSPTCATRAVRAGPRCGGPPRPAAGSRRPAVCERRRCGCRCSGRPGRAAPQRPCRFAPASRAPGWRPCPWATRRWGWWCAGRCAARSWRACLPAPGSNGLRAGSAPPWLRGPCAVRWPRPLPARPAARAASRCGPSAAARPGFAGTPTGGGAGAMPRCAGCPPQPLP